MARWTKRSESDLETVWVDLDNPRDVRVEYHHKANGLKYLMIPDPLSDPLSDPSPDTSTEPVATVALSRSSYRTVILVSGVAGALAAIPVDLGLHALARIL